MNYAELWASLAKDRMSAAISEQTFAAVWAFAVYMENAHPQVVWHYVSFDGCAYIHNNSGTSVEVVDHFDGRARLTASQGRLCIAEGGDWPAHVWCWICEDDPADGVEFDPPV